MIPESAANPIVDDALARTARLATLPEITVRILEVIDEPDVTAGQLESLVSADPVLSARVLKVVNSSFYGMPASVKSIKQAVMLLGINSLKNIALAASLSKLFREKAVHENFDVQGIWTHSVATGCAARLLGAYVGDDSDELFLIGLLHDVGTVVQLQSMRAEFVELLEAREEGASEPFGESFIEAEKRIIGASHEELGLALCRNWNFPEAIQCAVGFHHMPDALEGDGRRIAQIICVADYVASASAMGYCCAAGSGMPTSVLHDLELSEEVIVEVFDKLPEAAFETEALFA